MIDGLIFHKLDPDVVSHYDQRPELVASMKGRIARGVCMFSWCADKLFLDGRCQEHHEDDIKPYVPPAAAPVKPKTCKTINCGEPIAKEGLCADHYNSLIEEELAKKEPKLSAKQIKEAKEHAKELDTEFLEGLVDKVNLEWWFEHYGETELPAKFINPEFYILEHWDTEQHGEVEEWRVKMADFSKADSLWINEKLKELDGTPLNGGSHIWTFTGRKHYKREGEKNHFACVPTEGP